MITRGLSVLSLSLSRSSWRYASTSGSRSTPRGCDFFVCFQIVHARARRRFQRGLKRRPMGLIKKLRKAKKEAPPNEKPAVVKTHLRDMIIVPEMIGSVVGIYNGKVRSHRGSSSTASVLSGHAAN